MSDYDNTNRGVLFKNDDKLSDKHADYRGSINVDGREFWLDAWIKEAKSGKRKFMSLSIKPKEPNPPPGQPGYAARRPAPDLQSADPSDEIPF